MRISEERVGRGGGIRTHDPSVPNAVRYQTALRPDIDMIIRDAGVFVKYFADERVEAQNSASLRVRLRPNDQDDQNAL